MHLTFYLMKFALQYEHVSAVEGAPDGSSQGTPAFEVDIKGALEVTIEFHLKMHMVVHLLVQKSSQNNSIKNGTLCWRYSMLHLKVHLRFRLKHKKLQKFGSLVSPLYLM